MDQFQLCFFLIYACFFSLALNQTVFALNSCSHFIFFSNFILLLKLSKKNIELYTSHYIQLCLLFASADSVGSRYLTAKTWTILRVPKGSQ